MAKITGSNLVSISTVKSAMLRQLKTEEENAVGKGILEKGTLSRKRYINFDVRRGTARKPVK